MPELLKNGEIRKLPKANSPLFVEQWAYQGTAKVPYVVSRRVITVANQIEWSCSCKSWTTTIPRQACKHIVAIQLKEKLLVSATAVPSSLSPELQNDFKNFLAQKQAREVKSGKSALEERGRKFRTE
jgi:hypothetical protein